jgi:putative membrane protein
LALSGLAISAFIAAQLIGFGPIEQLARRLAARLMPTAAAGNASVQDSIRSIYRMRGNLLLGILLHFLGWIATGIEAWIALRFMGVAVGPGAVLVIESLLYAIRSAAFAVPNAIGVQEGAYIMLGAVFGLSPETVLALSLLKRARDGVIGVPTLLIWQAAEGARLRERRPPAV